MSIDIKWNVEGLDQLEQALTELAFKDSKRILRKASKEGMLHVVKSMAANAGYDETSQEAHMRDEITIKMKFGNTKAGKNTALTTYVGPKKAHYMKAVSQEYGNSRQDAKPFMRTALEDNAQKVVQTFKETLIAEIAKTQRKYANRKKKEAKEAAKDFRK